MKILLAVVITACCAYMGVRFGARYRRREQVFSDTSVFIDGCRSRIGFSRLPLRAILTEYLETVGDELAGLLRQFLTLLDGGGYVDYAALAETLSCPYLTREELKLYAQFFDSLGKADSSSQMATLAEYGASFSKKHDAAAEDKKKFGSMYAKLGVLCGLGLSVLVF